MSALCVCVVVIVVVIDHCREGVVLGGGVIVYLSVCLFVSTSLTSQDFYNSLPQGQSRLEELAKGLEDFHVLVETLQQHKKEVTSKVTSFESDLQQKMEEIQQTEDRITRLQHRIDNQTYTKEDVYQLEREKAQMEENIAQTLGRRQEYESMILNGELDLKRELERLERLAVPFNREMEKLELLEGHTECTNTQIMVQKNQVRENDQRVLLGQVDLKHEINPTLTKMNEAYINDTTQIKSNLLETMEKQMKGEEEIRNLKDNMEVSKVYCYFHCMHQDFYTYIVVLRIMTDILSFQNNISIDNY